MKIRQLLEDSKSNLRTMLRIQSELIEKLPEECDVLVKMPSNIIIVDANKFEYTLTVNHSIHNDFQFEKQEYNKLENIIIDVQYLIVANILITKCGFVESVIDDFNHDGGGDAIIEKEYILLNNKLKNLQFSSNMIGRPGLETEKYYNSINYPDITVCVYCFEKGEYSVSLIKSNQ